MSLLSRRRLLLLTPLAVATMGGSASMALLHRMKEGAFDPHGMINPLVGQSAPRLNLPGLTSDDKMDQPILVNFFASWCEACLGEMRCLATLQKIDIPMWGIAYKDKPDTISKFLQGTGNPYTQVGFDVSGDTAIDWGVTGVPETFLLDRNGVIRWHWSGPLTTNMLVGIRGMMMAI
jgi:cytochrome c biogenesis protein CcmG, thiol:disulfide interchange protein DsbE